MAEENSDGQEKTEEPTDEQRDKFKEKGDIPHSREITSTLALFALILLFTYYTKSGIENLIDLLRKNFFNLHRSEFTVQGFFNYLRSIWIDFVKIITPICLTSIFVASLSTFAQTRFNIAWSRLKPSWQKLNIITGLQRMVSIRALVELLKSLGKLLVVGLVAFLILYGEWHKVPSLLMLNPITAWIYWADITQNLFFAVACLLLFIGVLDYLYNFFSMENKMKMTKQQVKEEFKQREIDPFIKGRMRKMQRDIIAQKSMEGAKEATVLITNPTHYSIAVKYELGMEAPVVVGKGLDFLALRMREIAKEHDVPIVENRPLARTLYADVDIGGQIPERLYKAVSEVLRYVFKLKGIKVGS